MPFTISENWDGVTAPAIPSGWNVDAPFATSTTQQNSLPNSLKLGTVSAGVTYYATNSSADPGGGSLVDTAAYVYFDSSAAGSEYDAGPTFRCSSATMDNSTTSCYWVRLQFRQLGTSQVAFSKVVNGTVTDVATFGSATYPLAGSWYSIGVKSTAPDTFNVQFIRLSDGYSMDGGGAFSAGDNYVIANLHDASIPSGSYSGVAASAADSDMIYIDNINVSTTIPSYPRKPVIARVPFQYYIVD